MGGARVTYPKGVGGDRSEGGVIMTGSREGRKVILYAYI